jgi:hypothetical protein
MEWSKRAALLSGLSGSLRISSLSLYLHFRNTKESAILSSDCFPSLAMLKSPCWIAAYERRRRGHSDPEGRRPHGKIEAFSNEKIHERRQKRQESDA